MFGGNTVSAAVANTCLDVLIGKDPEGNEARSVAWLLKELNGHDAATRDHRPYPGPRALPRRRAGHGPHGEGAGHIWVNTIQVIPPNTAWGGFKRSGIGRELGPWGLSAYQGIKHITRPA